MPDHQPRYRSRPGRMSTALWAALASLVALLAAPLTARAALLDDFEDLSAWSTGALEGVSVELAQDEGRRGMAIGSTSTSRATPAT